MQKSESIDTSHPLPSTTQNEERAKVPQRLETLERYLKELKGRVEALEGAVIESVPMEYIEELLDALLLTSGNVLSVIGRVRFCRSTHQVHELWKRNMVGLVPKAMISDFGISELLNEATVRNKKTKR